MNLCECGICGREVTKEGNRYICGHNQRGKTKENDEGVKKQSEKIKVYMKNGGAIFAYSFQTKEDRKRAAEKQAEKLKGRTKENHSGVRRAAEKSRINTKENNDGRRRQSEYMENGGSVHAASFITNPSKIQVETWKITSLLFPYVYLNYPVYRGKGKKNYSIDIAVPKLDIAIEVDGSYWHQDKEKDLKRQKELEVEGWNFLRYEDIVPTLEQVSEDIKRVLE